MHENLVPILDERSIPEPMSGCFLWIKGADKDGYGKLSQRVDGKREHLRAHRVSWEISAGRPVPDGMLVTHSCDNPPCVNPRHLRLGTTADNNHESQRKGRASFGNARIGVEIAAQIAHALFVKGMAMTRVASTFHVPYKIVWRIRTRQSWRDVTKSVTGAP